MMLKKRLDRLEKHIIPAANAPKLIFLCDHLDEPHAALFVGGGDLAREAGEGKAAFIARASRLLEAAPA